MFWERPVRCHSESICVLSDTGIILEYTQRIIPVAGWVLSGCLIYTRPPVGAVTVPLVPILADSSCLLECTRFSVGPNSVRISLSLEYLHGQPPRSVVRDMTMHQPASWVVSFKGDDNEAVPRQQNHITPRRIYQSEIEQVWRILCVFDLVENCKVMAVQVDLDQI